MKPLWVLLPGMDGTGLLFEPFLKFVTAETLVISYPHDRVMNYNQLANLVIEKLPKRPLILIAESFSGAVAQRVLQKAPGLVLGVVFVASFLQSPRPFLLRISGFLPSLLFKPMPPMISRGFLLGSGADRAFVSLFQKAVRNVQPRVLRERLVMIAHLRSPQQKVHIPACCIHGAEDRLVPKSCSRHFTVSFPNLQTQIILGPHLLLQAMPQISAQIISNFAARYQASSRSV